MSAKSDPQSIADAVAQDILKRDRSAIALGIRLEEVAPGRSVLSMEVRRKMTNGHDIGHGGYTFTLADTAFAFACNSHNQASVAQSCEIHFIAPASLGDRLTATCQERDLDGDTGIYDTVVTNQDGRMIALFRGRSRGLGQEYVPGLSGDG
jgi:acyl-CoA thioesterase